MQLEGKYLKGVLPYEMGPGAPTEALKAQAVAARCYAMNAIKSPRHAPDADVCATTHCQVWKEGQYLTTNAVVEVTKGVVATYNGEVINAFYFGHCNGKTRRPTEAYPDPWMVDLPYLKPVDCLCGYDSMYGHGVGMCQRGAIRMAQQGANYKEILWHYYTGCEVDGEKAPEKPDPIQEILQDIARAKSKIEGQNYLNKQALESLDAAEERLLEL